MDSEEQKWDYVYGWTHEGFSGPKIREKYKIQKKQKGIK